LTSSPLIANKQPPAGRRSSERHHVGASGDMIAE
jgi:hypothetical protein